MKPLSQFHRSVIRLTNQTDYHVDGIKQHIKPNTNPHPLAEEAGKRQLRDTRTTGNVT